MGFSIAEEAEKRGAKVILISGPTAQKTKNENIEIKNKKCKKKSTKTNLRTFTLNLRRS